MDTLKIAICEDDEIEYNALRRTLDSCNIAYDSVHFTNALPLVNTFYSGKYDLLFMDIYMEGMNGVEAVSKIRETDQHVPIAFLTTSLSHALDGYRYHVNRYLTKPTSPAEILEVLNLALELKNHVPSLSLSINNEILTLPFSRIRYAEQDGRNVTLYLTGNSIQNIPTKLAELAKKLPSPPFFQCHKSYLVNLIHVRFLNLDLNVFEMNEGGNAYIRRGSLKDAKNAYQNYMFELTRKQLEDRI